ncbi:hypothetical protein GE09DRAFT_45736 [Coniochaeta sp. 2T2.1]|nr:hypothetical protein GE09DRAFT_45736 [Coniochaeta sp. 2T2.1]
MPFAAVQPGPLLGSQMAYPGTPFSSRRAASELSGTSGLPLMSRTGQAYSTYDDRHIPAQAAPLCLSGNFWSSRQKVAVTLSSAENTNIPANHSTRLAILILHQPHSLIWHATRLRVVMLNAEQSGRESGDSDLSASSFAGGRMWYCTPPHPTWDQQHVVRVRFTNAFPCRIIERRCPGHDDMEASPMIRETGRHYFKVSCDIGADVGAHFWCPVFVGEYHTVVENSHLSPARWHPSNGAWELSQKRGLLHREQLHLSIRSRCISECSQPSQGLACGVRSLHGS